MIHRSPPLPDARRLQGFKRTLIERHVRPENYRGLARVLTTLVPLATLWYLAVASVAQSYWLSAGCIALMSLFLLRAFVLMHECGHGSLFRTPLFNKACGFLFGIVSGFDGIQSSHSVGTVNQAVWRYAAWWHVIAR